MTGMPADTRALLDAAMPHVVEVLSDLAGSPDTAIATEALDRLEGYLRDERVLAATVELNSPKAAHRHLDALRWIDERRASLAAQAA